jgi:sugar-specific transcriptional regulator TrmB
MQSIPLSHTLVLTNIGLSQEEAVIYELLLTLGTSRASRLVPKSGMKRGMVYKTLDILVDKNLIEKITDDTVQKYRVLHPKFLENTLKHEVERVEKVSKELDANIGILTSLFNLATGKPNIQFFEGEKGFRQILEESLRSKETILQWSDANLISSLYKNLNDEYVSKRIKKNIPKKVLAVASGSQKIKIAERLKDTPLSEFRFLPENTLALKTIIMVYEHTVAMVTIAGEGMIAIQIEDESIASTMKAIFNTAWDKAVKL